MNEDRREFGPEVEKSGLNRKIQYNRLAAGGYQFPRTIDKKSALSRRCYLCAVTYCDAVQREPGFYGEATLQREHILPKVLFRPYNPDPSAIAFVCKVCHDSKSLNDEFITRQLQAGGYTSAAAEAFGGFADTFERYEPQRIGMKTEYVRRIVAADRMDCGANLTNSALRIEIDPDRFNDFVVNIAKGLWTRSSHQIMDWSEYDIEVLSLNVQNIAEFLRKPCVETIIKCGRVIESWGDTFEVVGQDVAQGTVASSWLMAFYHSTVALVIFKNKS